jgi:hypothetical protein
MPRWLINFIQNDMIHNELESINQNEWNEHYLVALIALSSALIGIYMVYKDENKSSNHGLLIVTKINCLCWVLYCVDLTCCAPWYKFWLFGEKNLETA